MTRSILVPSVDFDSVHKRLARLASKAGVTLEVVAGETKYYRLAKKTTSHAYGGTYTRLVLDQRQVLVCKRLTVGELPRLNGYSFVGKIVHTEAGNILAMAQNPDLPAVTLEAWRNAKPTCDHCNTVRSRNDTFLICTPEGTIRRVGRNCLADFLKVDPAEMVALSAFEDSLREIEADDSDGDNLPYGSGGRWSIDTLHYLACAVSCTEKLGFWKSRNEQDKTPTASSASFAAGDRPRQTRDNQDLCKMWDSLQPTLEHEMIVIGIYSWLADQPSTENYMHNLQVACLLPDARRETMGLLASAPTAYARALGAVAAKATAAIAPKGGHWSAIGKRDSTEVTVTRIGHCESDFGTKTIVTMVTAEGCQLITFTTSSDVPKTEDIGKKFHIKGTVKRHETDKYTGRPQTTLSRVAFTAL